NPTTLPVWVRDAASLLRESVGHYVFISTISVYADTSRPGMDETGELARYEGADPLAETMESFMANLGGLYGPLKAASEREAERWRGTRGPTRWRRRWRASGPTWAGCTDRSRPRRRGRRSAGSRDARR